MSYSFTVKAPSADVARALVAEKYAEILETQPIHARDQAACAKAVKELVSLVSVPEGKVLSISVGGSCGWDGKLGEDGDVSNVVLNGVGLNVSVSLADAEKEKM